MKHFLLPALLPLLAVTPACAQFGVGGPRDFDSVVRKIEATIEPATAKRGETVTWRLKIELAPGWHTYPTKQPEAAASSYVNKVTPPKKGDAIFVGSLTEPANPIKHPVAEEKIKALEYYEIAAT